MPWIFSCALLGAAATATKADICDPGEATLITHPVLNNLPSTVIQCPRSYAEIGRPAPKHLQAKPRVVEESHARRPKLVHHLARSPNLLDALASIFRPHHRR